MFKCKVHHSENKETYSFSVQKEGDEIQVWIATVTKKDLENHHFLCPEDSHEEQLNALQQLFDGKFEGLFVDYEFLNDRSLHFNLQRLHL
jgi:hypothetical protein